MTYVITEACIGVKDRSCVDVCPVDCIPVHPLHVETPAQLRRKYEALMAAALLVADSGAP